MNRKPAIAPTGRRLWASRVIDAPEPGFYRMKLVKGGALVGCRIIYEPTRDPHSGEVLDRSLYWSAEVNGRPDGEPSITPGREVMKIWTSGERIDEAEYRFLIADRAWAAAHAKGTPAADPAKPIDLMTAPLPSF